MASSALLVARLLSNQSSMFPFRKPSIEARSRRKMFIISSQKNKSKNYRKEELIGASKVNDDFLSLSPSRPTPTARSARAPQTSSAVTRTTPVATTLASIMKQPRRRRRRGSQATSSSKTVSNNLFSLAILIAAISSIQLANCSMCQHHQAMIEAAAAAASTTNSPAPGLTVPAIAPAAAQSQNLIVCPKSSQYNNLPQFPPRFVSPTLERQQREILNQLNVSFANHLQLNGSPSGVGPKQTLPTDATRETLPSELIDDELLNEIISPLVVDAAYERAKELIVKRRKLENELVKQGKCLHLTANSMIVRNLNI